ncbi:unnamed protein product, partial [marine sediment metagenome]
MISNTSPLVLLDTDLSLPLFIRGKVRDTYDLGNRLLIIATDRISAFDVAICLGRAFGEALGEKRSIVRMGDATVPMDDALATVAVVNPAISLSLKG